MHDSNDAESLILGCISEIRTHFPRAAIEVRMDRAFFSDTIVSMLEAQGVGFTISVPFERFSELKGLVENRKRWKHLGDKNDHFESRCKPKSWGRKQRLLFIRSCNRRQHKGPVQLDLFIPYEYGFDFKLIVTNKKLNTGAAVAYHNGRDAQESLFAELKFQI